MKTRYWRSVQAVFFLLVATGIASRAHAQATTSSIVGAINDQTSAALPGATITAKHLETGLVRTASSEADGRYVLAGMPLGAYEVRAELKSFRPTLRRGVRVVVGEPAVVNFPLEVQPASDEVTVTGGAPLVQTRSGE